jgi:hypothetical protein
MADERVPVTERTEALETVDREQVTVVTLPDVPFEPSAALQQAITKGAVTTKYRTVEFKVRKDGKLEKIFRQTYTSCAASNREGAIALPGIDGDDTVLWEFVSGRADQTVYQPVYVALKSEAEGPQRKITTTAKKLVDLGLFKSIQDAINDLCAKMEIPSFTFEEKAPKPSADDDNDSDNE